MNLNVPDTIKDCFPSYDACPSPAARASLCSCRPLLLAFAKVERGLLLHPVVQLSLPPLLGHMRPPIPRVDHVRWVLIHASRPTDSKDPNVIIPPGLGVAEDFVYLGDLVEPLECVVIVGRVHVGVVLLREVVIGGLDLLRRRTLTELEGVVMRLQGFESAGSEGRSGEQSAGISPLGGRIFITPTQIWQCTKAHAIFNSEYTDGTISTMI